MGSLSIIRFRTPIKEPEEVGFLLLVIAASVAAATYNFAFLVILYAFAFASLLIMRRVRFARFFKRDGLLVKFPFDTQQEDYPYWDGALGRSVTAEFQGEETIEGASTYKFVMALGPEEVSESEGLPGALFGTDEPVDAGRIYQNTRTLWVEPNTGAIIKGLEEQNVHFAPRDTSLPTVPITVGTIGYTDETVAANADEFGSSGSTLAIIRDHLTWIGLVAGLALLALGAFLTLGGSRTPRPAGDGAGYDDAGYDPEYDDTYDAGADGAEDTELLTRRMHRERDTH